MDLTLSADQELLRDTARSLLSRERPVDAVRARIGGDEAATDRLWPAVKEWVAVAGPGRNGAGIDGGTMVSLCLWLEEAGASLLPGPFLPTAGLFVPLIAASGHDLIAPALAGEATGTLAVAGHSGEWIPNDEPVKLLVPEASSVDYVAAVNTLQTSGELEVALYPSPAVEVTATVDPSRVLASVDLSESAPLGAPTTLSHEQLRDVLERAVVAVSAEMLGTARWILDSTLEHAKSREQFGRPIGSFQAVKHKLANMALVLDQAWSAVYHAAMTIDEASPERHAAAHVAKVMAGEAARLNAKDGMQIHGGIGYTFEHDLHLYLRRAYASEYLLGSSDWHRDQLADLVLGAPAGG